MQSAGGPVDAGDLGCMPMAFGRDAGEGVGLMEVVFGVVDGTEDVGSISVAFEEDVTEDVGSFSVAFEEDVTTAIGSTKLVSGDGTLSELLGVTMVVVIVRAIRVV